MKKSIAKLLYKRCRRFCAAAIFTTLLQFNKNTSTFAIRLHMDFIYRLKEINQAALKTFEWSNGRKVWAIHGEMGAGKTTFIHALCENLGVTSAIGSPTYSIINEYKSDEGIIYHMDWYRLKDEEEALQAGVEECMYTRNLCLIEWPEKAISLLPDGCFHIHINVVNKETRRILIV